MSEGDGTSLSPDELGRLILEAPDDVRALEYERAALEQTDNGWQPDDPDDQPDQAEIKVRKFQPIRSRLLRPRLAVPRGFAPGRTAEDVIRVAESQVGFVEGRNNDSPYGRWYGLNHQPYCAMAVCWCHDQVGQRDLVNFSTSKGYSYTVAGALGFQKRGQWGTKPRRGAHIFFNFNGRRIHHVGIVLDWTASYVNTVEFNTSRGTAGSQRDGGGCWRRRRSAGIVGYGYPAYSSAGPGPGPAPTPPTDRDRRYPGGPGYSLKNSRGRVDGNVAWAQRRLNATNLEPKLRVDGVFGPATDQAVRGFQGARGFPPEERDGIIGEKTWRELQKI